MSTGLFAESKPEPTPDAPESGDGDERSYRAMSGPAVIGAVAGLLSALLFASWFFIALPVISIVFAGWGLAKIRHEPQYYMGKGLAYGGILLAVGFLAGGVTYHVQAYAIPPGYERISYEQLRDPYVEIDFPPPSALKLDDKKIFIEGYIYPPPGVQPGDPMTEFLLCRDQGECCFGGEPKSVESIWVSIGEEHNVTYSTKAVGVGGYFDVLEQPPASDTTSGRRIYYTLQADYAR